MKKIKKTSLKLEKEVIANLSDEKLASMIGGVDTGSFGTQCACPTIKDNTCSPNCGQVEGPSKKQPCKPILYTLYHTCGSNVGCAFISNDNNCAVEKPSVIEQTVQITVVSNIDMELRPSF